MRPFSQNRPPRRERPGRREALRHRSAPGLRAAAAGLLTLLAAAGALAAGPTFAILSVQDRVADPELAVAVERSLAASLAERGSLVERERVRPALRSLRLRRFVDAAPGDLAEVASGLAADWLLAVTVLEARRGEVPAVTLAGWAVAGQPGSEPRSAFVSATGIDGRRLLGLGEIHEIDLLASTQVAELLDRLGLPGGALEQPARGGLEGAAPIGPVAVIPLTSLIPEEASLAAEAATEALYAVLQEKNVRVVPPNVLDERLRRHRVRRWGQLDSETRATIAAECGARLVLTGSVEAYSAEGGLEPRPEVTVALRALDAATGRIVWNGSEERTGWYRQKLFRLGRVHSRGDLVYDLLRRLTSELIAAAPALAPKEVST